MRKLTVLLLSGALLAITGGVSVAEADEFAILQCFGGGADAGFSVWSVDTSFDTPAECAVKSTDRESCSKCVQAITERWNLELAVTNLGEFDQFQNRFVFTERRDDEKGKHRGRDKDED